MMPVNAPQPPPQAEQTVRPRNDNALESGSDTTLVIRISVLRRSVSTGSREA